MVTDPTSLIQEAIQQLEKLSAFLADEVQSGRRGTSLPPKKRISKEALLSISVLIPKLRAARSLHAHENQIGRTCPHCED
jgi:hypothetical protein